MNSTSAKPMYEIIYDDLKKNIEEGHYKSGEKVPTEKEVADQYRVSRITSKKAYDMLVAQGYIYRHPGRGSFVLDSYSAQPASEDNRNHPPRKQGAVLPTVIGYITPDYDDSYGPRLFYGLERKSAETGCFLTVRRSLGIREEEEEAIQFLMNSGVDGLVIWPSSNDTYNNQILKLVVEKFPLVLVDRPLKGLDAVSVCTDNAAAAVKATNYLLELGHEKIGFIAPPTAVTTVVDDRIQGYIQSHAENGIMVQKILELPDTTYFHTDSQKNVEAIRSYLSETNPTAVITAEYNIANMAAVAAESLGLQIPQDLSILCFDHPAFSSEQRRFTHMRQREEEMGKKAFETLLQLIQGNEALSSSYEADLVVGNTTAKRS
ncbi:GntR family transcriptional regulator [Paenibacillus gansuensis]|uniref:GntR family transcriptional regulator n=1 Tax=Paenibacillus gansuensis TaxID=306542 RepID=A0ABW5P7A4_9BACL